MKKFSWITSNLYGKVFGWPLLKKFHHAVITLTLHALGYGNMFRESWTGEEWFIKKVLAKQQPKVVFDVGANVGNYSRMLHKYLEAEIYTFEPNPKAFKYLSELPEAVHKVQAAVSDNDGNAVLNYKLETDGKASLDPNVRQGSQVKVSCLKLETFCRQNGIENIDFLKIDTEGFEREVIMGLGNMRPKYIQFEFNINQLIRGYTVYDISQILDGYTFYRLLPNGWIKIDSSHYVDNIFLFSNYVAVLTEDK